MVGALTPESRQMIEVETSTLCYKPSGPLDGTAPSGTLGGVKPIPGWLTQSDSYAYLFKVAIRAEKTKDYPTAVTAYDMIVKKATASRTASVQGMRTYGYHSWAEIAKALDMSAQGAWEKYSHSGLVTDPPDRIADRNHPKRTNHA